MGAVDLGFVASLFLVFAAFAASAQACSRLTRWAKVDALPAPWQ